MGGAFRASSAEHKSHGGTMLPYTLHALTHLHDRNGIGLRVDSSRLRRTGYEA